MSNPIELLIALGVDKSSKDNIDTYLKGIKKYYDNNPTLITLDVNQSRSMTNINKFLNKIRNEKIELDIDFKGGKSNVVKSALSDFDNLSDVVKGLEKSIGSLNQKMSKTGGMSTSSLEKSLMSYDLDIKKALIDLDNLGRQGKISESEIGSLRGQLNDLYGTLDRLSLKELRVEMKDVTSQATHADKVIEKLKKQLKSLEQEKAKMTKFGDKLGIGNTKEFQAQMNAIQGQINSVNDSIRNVSIGDGLSTSNADNIRIADELRRIEEGYTGLTAKLSEFKAQANSNNAFEKMNRDALQLITTLERLGQVDRWTLDEASFNIDRIGNSSASAEKKIAELEKEIRQLKTTASDIKLDDKMEDATVRTQNQLDKLEAKLTRISQIHKKTYDKDIYRELAAEIEKHIDALDKVGDLRGFTKLNNQISMTAAGIDKLGANATTAAHASQGLLYSLKTALQKFPV